MNRASSVEHAPDAVEVFDLVHARILRFFPELVEELGGDERELMQHVGIDPAAHFSGASSATYRQMVQLVERAASELDVSDFGMRLAKLQGGGMFGPLGAVMKNSRTFGDALEYVSKHAYAHSLAAGIWMKRSPSEGAVFIGHDILVDGAPNKSQALEQIMLLGHLAAMEMTGGKARARRVHFRHQPVSALKVYRRYFGCEVRFGQHEDGILFFDRDLGSPIIGPDAFAYAAAASFIDAEFLHHTPPLHAQARGAIMQLLGTERCTHESIAKTLNLHPRTMHRRLKEEGTSFQQIKGKVRGDVMLYYIQQTDLEFACISERLGFAEQSVMTRFCKQWFGAAPTQLRVQQRRPALN